MTQSRLHIEYTDQPAADLLADDRVLGAFQFSASPAGTGKDARHIRIGLPQLGGQTTTEVWRTESPVQHWNREHISAAWCDHYSLLQIHVPLADFSGTRAAARFAYQELLTFADQAEHSWPLKIWHHVPAINAGEGDEENYRQFCEGRAEAFPGDIGDQPSMPAATAIGAPAAEPKLQLICLAAAEPGLRIENPRQMNAWRYPRQYGPKSPIFSRGTVIGDGRSRQFLISGTASVVGHETRHEDDIEAQIDETMANLDSLLAECARVLDIDQPGFNPESPLKIYVRNPDHLPAIDAGITQAIGAGAPRLYLQADICRSDLLVEIDGVLPLV